MSDLGQQGNVENIFYPKGAAKPTKVMHSAETRWFFPGSPHKDLRKWFLPCGDVKPTSSREDEYLIIPDCKTLGIKFRGDGKPTDESRLKMDIKILSLPGDPFKIIGSMGKIEQWTKWPMESAGPKELLEDLHKFCRWCSVRKKTWLRKFSFTETVVTEVETDIRPKIGCKVELTSVSVVSEQNEWYSLGFEAFNDDGDPATVLRLTLEKMLANSGLPSNPKFTLKNAMSYPEWLAEMF